MSKQVSGIQRLFYGNNPVTGNPTDNPLNWTDINRPLNAWEPGNVTGSVEDALGAPVHANAQIARVYELLDLGNFVALRALEDARTRLDIAEKYLDGTFRVLKYCKIFVEYMPNPGPNRIQTIKLEVYAAADSWTSIREIRVPA